MKVFIDNLLDWPYSLSMENTKEIKKKLEMQLGQIQRDLAIIAEYERIGERYSDENVAKFNSELAKMKSGESFLDQEEIEKIILKMKGDFKNTDVAAKLEEVFPNATVSKSAIQTALYRLKQLKKIMYVREREGRRPAIYRVI